MPYASWLTVAIILSSITISQAESWNQFRGSGLGNLPAIQHPTKWSGQKNLAWSVPLKGSGWSSPVVAGDRVLYGFAADRTLLGEFRQHRDHDVAGVDLEEAT